MWPFKRKQTSTDKVPAMPPELTDYYQAEKRQQTIVTWLLGFATLAVTIAVAFGIFLGARWIVHKVRKSPTSQPVATQNAPKQTEAPKDETKTQSTNGTTSQSSGSTSAQPSANGQAKAGSTTPQTSSATTALPNTGPTDTLAVFMVVTIAGATFHAVTRQKRV